MADGLVVVEHGMVKFLNVLRASWAGDLRMGLHQNALPPNRTWTINTIEPALFSGYIGLIPVVAWANAAMSGLKAVTKAATLEWAHNGGPTPGYVCGYYVIDATGELVWVQRDTPPFRVMLLATDRYLVRPEFSGGSEFPL